MWISFQCFILGTFSSWNFYSSSFNVTFCQHLFLWEWYSLFVSLRSPSWRSSGCISRVSSEAAVSTFLWSAVCSVTPFAFVLISLPWLTLRIFYYTFILPVLIIHFHKLLFEFVTGRQSCNTVTWLWVNECLWVNWIEAQWSVAQTLKGAMWLVTDYDPLMFNSLKINLYS